MIKITLKGGEVYTYDLSKVVKIEYPKVKTMLIRFTNGGCNCFYTGAIEKIEIV